MHLHEGLYSNEFTAFSINEQSMSEQSDNYLFHINGLLQIQLLSMPNDATSNELNT